MTATRDTINDLLRIAQEAINQRLDEAAILGLRPELMAAVHDGAAQVIKFRGASWVLQRTTGEIAWEGHISEVVYEHINPRSPRSRFDTS